jgi:hypothetical protein
VNYLLTLIILGRIFPAMTHPALFLPPASPTRCPACRTAPVRTDWQLCPSCSDLLSDDEAQDAREAAKRAHAARQAEERAAEDAEWERHERADRADRLACYSEAELAAFRLDPSEPSGLCVFCRGTTSLRLLAQPCCQECQKDAQQRLGVLDEKRRADVADVLERIGRISFAWCATDHCSELAEIRMKADALLEVLS